VILNGTQYPNYLIGGLNQLDLSVSQDFMLEPPTNEIFKVELLELNTTDGKIYTCVYVRLLPMLRGATYVAVIGEKL
jgi:hypothetical protein